MIWAWIGAAAVGLSLGLLGAGGAVLIVPMLVLVRRLPMHRAVGTSLAVITINSISGFLQITAMSSAGAAAASICERHAVAGRCNTKLFRGLSPFDAFRTHDEQTLVIAVRHQTCDRNGHEWIKTLNASKPDRQRFSRHIHNLDGGRCRAQV